MSTEVRARRRPSHRRSSGDAQPERSAAGRQRPSRGSALRTRRSFWEHNEKGVYLYRRRAYDLAIAELERAVSAAVFPLAVLYINLGAAYLGNRMYPEARACLEKGLVLDPDNQRGHWFLARTLKATGAVAEAVAEFEQAWVLDPDSPEGRTAEEDVLWLKEDDTVWRGQSP